MSNISAQPEGYLAEQLAKANAELSQEMERVNQAKEQADQYLPAVEQAAQAASQKLRHIIQTQIDAEQAKARQEALPKALTLFPIAKKGIVTVILWLILIFVIPFFIKSILGWIISIGVYVWLVKTGMRKEAAQKTKKRTDSLTELSRAPVSFMHFGDKESGDSAYPYSVIRAPWPNRNQFSTTWRIDKKFGSKFDSDFVVLHGLDEATRVYCVVEIPKNGQAPQVIDTTANTEAWDWPLHVDILTRFGEQLQAEAKTIEEYALHAQGYERVLQQQASLAQRVKTLNAVMHDWTDVSIEEQTLDRVLKLVDLFISGRKPSPKGVLLYGPPGTGKTLIARKLAKHADCHFEAVNISDLKAGHIGQTAPRVKELWERCRQHSPTILFVDECESAFAKRGGADNDSFGNELVQTFISEWDGFNQASGQVFVVAATNRHDILDNAILSRFTTSVEIGLPNDVARRKILANEFAQADLNIEVSNDLVTETSGMSGRDIHTLVATLVAENLNADISAAQLVEQVRKVRGKGSTAVKNLTWDDIILPEQTLQEFQNLGKELRNAEKLEAMGISTPKGILLYGPPGTGKTQIARVLASQSGLSFIGAATTDLKANYLGQSANKVKQLFEQARSQAPCILFIDEIDIVAGVRGGDLDTLSQEVIGQLLQELDGVSSKKGVFLLAASNHPDNIDAAVLSRLERKIEIGLPDQEARRKILYWMLAKKPLAFELETVLETLALETHGFSGRDLNSLVTLATRNAVNRTLQAGEDIESLKIEADDVLAMVRSMSEE